MKVSDIKQGTAAVDLARAKAAETPAPQAGGGAGAQDRVTVQAARSVETAIASAKSSSGGAARTARLERLEAQVRGGTYRAEASRVAEQILADAVVDARLQALLRR